MPADVLTRRRSAGAIGDLFGLYVDDVALVPSGTVGRTTSGKVQRAATKARYEQGELGRGGDRPELSAMTDKLMDLLDKLRAIEQRRAMFARRSRAMPGLTVIERVLGPVRSRRSTAGRR